MKQNKIYVLQVDEALIEDRVYHGEYSSQYFELAPERLPIQVAVKEEVLEQAFRFATSI